MSFLSGRVVPVLGAKYGITTALGVGALSNLASFIIFKVFVTNSFSSYKVKQRSYAIFYSRLIFSSSSGLKLLILIESSIIFDTF